jgi:hypothetical protein
MLIIIEGPDNSGKSTLASWLAQSLNWRMMHSGGPVKTIEERDDRLNLLFKVPQPVVFDRFPCISERVYGPTLRAVDIFGDEHGQEWLRLFHSTPRCVIYCRAPLSLMLDLEHHVSKPGSGDDAKHVEAIKKNALALIHAYDRLMTEEEHLSYDWTAGGHQFRQLLLHHLPLSAAV